jgi:serine/threonine-protein kinase HipA
MAEAAGLAARGTVQRVEQVAARLLRELPAAVEEVAAMPAGSSMLKIFAKEIEERATDVRTHAGQEGVPELSEREDETPSSGASAFDP